MTAPFAGNSLDLSIECFIDPASVGNGRGGSCFIKIYNAGVLVFDAEDIAFDYPYVSTVALGQELGEDGTMDMYPSNITLTNVLAGAGGPTLGQTYFVMFL